jgi:hypothetical protein
VAVNPHRTDGAGCSARVEVRSSLIERSNGLGAVPGE